MRAHNVLLILVVALISGARYTEQLPGVSDWVVEEFSNGTIIIVNLDETYSESEITLEELETNVNYILYTRENTTGCSIYLEDDDSLTECNFNASLPTRFVIHGWESTITATMCSSVREAFLKQSNCNVIAVQWDTWASENYISARMKIAGIGQYLSLLFNYLVLKGMSAASTTVVGHSLGAHIGGVACRNTTSTIGLLLGLDPAGPLFYGKEMNARMRSDDAACTQMLHTSAGWLGYKEDLAKINFWANGGSKQPGCGWDLIRTCAHSRSYKYYAESIATDNFTTTKCDSYSDYTAGNCANNETTYLGFGCQLRASFGDYYFDTNSESPYSEG